MNKLIEKIVEKLRRNSQNMALIYITDKGVEYEESVGLSTETAISIIQEEAKAYNESVKGDLISRQLVIDVMWDVFNQYCNDADRFDEYETKAIDRAFKRLQSTLEKQPTACNDGWIPCKKQMPPQPKENPVFQNQPLELYLVTERDADYPRRIFWNGEFFTDGWEKVDVIAWQPLPEVFKL